MIKRLLAVLIFIVTACETTTTGAPEPADVSAEATLSYLQKRLVGWSAYDGNDWIQYDSVTLTDCVLTVSQRRSTKSGVHVLHHEYPLPLVLEAGWFPDLLPAGTLLVTGNQQSAVIRLRWDSEAAATYSRLDHLELPPEYGERIARAFNNLKQHCVPVVQDDPFK